jgi:hypothetical protein
MKKVLIGLVAVLAILVIVISTRPNTYTVSRALTVAAPQDVAFAQVNDFKLWAAWSPWAKMDPNMVPTYEGADSGVGAIYKWKGNDEVGQGMMTIKANKPPESIDIDLQFLEPFPSQADTLFTFAPDGEGTKVTWVMAGKANFMTKAFGLFMNMDEMIGKDFEKGLAQLKVAAEADAKARAEAKAAADAKIAAEAKAAEEAAAAAKAAEEAAAAEAAAKGKKKSK